jgi:hypothetical protein
MRDASTYIVEKHLPESRYLAMTQHLTPRTWRPLPSSTFLYSTAGAISALLGWALLEPFFQEGGSSGRVGLANAFIFPVVAGVVSASLVAVNKSVSRTFSGVIASAGGGFGLVFASTFLALVPSHVVFNWFSSTPQPGSPGMDQTASFAATLAGRTLAWSLIGTIIGLGTSLVIGRRGAFLSGMMGGLLGGLMAGMLFDPLQVLISGADKSPWISRMVGFIILGGMTGFLIGLMEDASGRGVLLITSGPRAGTRLVLDSKPCLVGSSTACDIVLPGDPEIGESGAVVQRIGLSFELKALGQAAMVQVNRRPISRTCLTHGDSIRIGGTDLLFSDPGRNKT